LLAVTYKKQDFRPWGPGWQDLRRRAGVRPAVIANPGTREAANLVNAGEPREQVQGFTGSGVQGLTGSRTVAALCYHFDLAN